MTIGRTAFWAPALLVAVAGALIAQQEYTQTRSSRERLAASPRSRTDVSVEYAGGRLKVATTEPGGSQRADVVIVIHTNRGLSDWARAVGDELAKEGYVSLVPDLLTGKGPRGGDTDSFESEDAVTKAIGSLDRDAADDRTRSGVTGEDRATDAQGVEERHGVGGEVSDAIADGGLVGVTVPALGHGDRADRSGEPVEHGLVRPP